MSARLYSFDPPGLLRIDSGNKQPHNLVKTGSGGGGDDMIEARVARLESDVEYIKRDVSDIKATLSSVNTRVIGIETSLKAQKITLICCGAFASTVFAFCTFVFGSYVSKILDAINTLVLK